MNNLSTLQKGSPDRFGYEWSLYSEIRPIYEEQFRRWLPFFSGSDWSGKKFLDVGCGMGRNSYWPLKDGALSGVSIDVDDNSLHSAKKNLGIFPNSQVIKMSAYDIEYHDEFDIAFSIGVIHHLEKPSVAIQAMKNSVKLGGKVAIWVYGFQNNQWLLHFLNPLRKAIFSKLPIGFVHHLSLYPTLILYPCLRIIDFKLAYLRLISQFDFKHLRSIIFDQMLPEIANYWTENEVRQIFIDARLKNIKVESVNGMSWAAVGER